MAKRYIYQNCNVCEKVTNQLMPTCGTYDTAKGFFQHHSWATAINYNLPQKDMILHPIYSLLTMNVGLG